MPRRFRWLAAFFGLALLSACSDDVPGPAAPEVPAGHWEETSILCSDYQDNRFFRLDLPPYPGGAHEELGYEYHDVPGRDPSSEFIDVNSIRVYRSLGEGPPEGSDLPYAAAALDTTGRWDEGHIDGLSLDSWHPAWYWRPVPLDLHRDEDGRLVAVDLRRGMARDDVLAVAYQVVDADGNTLYVVGDHPELGGERGLGIDGQDYYRLKLLKPELRDHFTFQYVLRNIYDLGARNIDLDSFELSIESRAPVDNPELHENGLDYLRLFGLDRENPLGEPVPDGLVDRHRPELFDLEKGLLTFPRDFPFPFGADEEIYRANASADPINWMWEDSRLQHQTESAMFYDWQTRPQDYYQSAQFELVVRHWVAAPEPPPLTSAAAAWESVQWSLDHGDPAGWLAVIGEGFAYIPDPETADLYPDELDGWNGEREAAFVETLFGAVLDLDAAMLQEDHDGPDGAGGYAEWTGVEYLITIPSGDGGIAGAYAGVCDLGFQLEGNTWRIDRWIDREPRPAPWNPDSTLPTSGVLRVDYRER